MMICLENTIDIFGSDNKEQTKYQTFFVNVKSTRYSKHYVSKYGINSKYSKRMQIISLPKIVNLDQRTVNTITILKVSVQMQKIIKITDYCRSQFFRGHLIFAVG